MKLFTQTVVDYVAALVDDELANDDRGELRIFTQSMPPAAVYRIFRGIRDYLAGHAARVRCETQVANGLYVHWRETGSDAGDIDRLRQRGWIDAADRLTHFRNLARGQDEDLLLVVLVGIDHATDRGGLADFYTLTDDVIFRDRMEASYQGWIGQALHKAGLADSSGTTTRDFDDFLRRLFQLRPRNLVALSTFLADELVPKAENCDRAGDFLGLAFENLPFWGVPPIFSPADPARRIARLSTAVKIFDRDRFRDRRERTKALEGIEQARPELGVAPQTRRGVAYADVEDFVTTLEEFVEKGSDSARERLLQTDFYVVTEILERRPKRSAKHRPARDQILRGPSLQVCLQAIFNTLQNFVAGCGRSWAPGQLQRVDFAIESFEFDGTEGDQDEKSADAEEVFRGLVGGLDTFLEDFKIAVRAQPDEEGEQLEVPIDCHFGYLGRNVAIRSKRLKESRMRFRVRATGETGNLSVERSFVWVLPPHHEERVRLTCARLMASELRDPDVRLPVIQLDSTLDELFFALDEGEAHRMFASGLSNAVYHDVLAGLQVGDLGSEMEAALAELSAAYGNFVRVLAEQGYFAALDKPIRDLVRTYQAAVDLALQRDEDKQAHGDGLLRRLYQAFLCVPAGTPVTSAYVPAVLATGVTPAIAETLQAREIFLREGFLQVAQRLLENGQRAGKAQFDRLLGLVELRRPLYGLVFDASRRLTTNLRSFGLLHRLGERPAVSPTLAAQAEMRAEDTSEGDSLSQYRRESPESRVIAQTLADYRDVHPYAADRLAVLAVNVEDLRPVIAGIDAFLSQQLAQQDPAVQTPYMLSVWIIGRGPSATAAQDVLRRWQESWAEETNRQQRPCRLKLAYRPARSGEEVLTLLEAVDIPHDVGFLFDFLNDQTGADSIVPAAAFTHDWRPGNIGKFPISEHPRPVRPTDPHIRQGLVSNRRFQLAARHAEITARLKNPNHPHKHHLIFNQVEYGERERLLTRCMHELSRWVACIDRFVDKSLILDVDGEAAEPRKLVGFTTGVGAYGEFNLTLSTESSTAGELLEGTAQQLGVIYRDWSAQDCKLAAQCLVDEAQAITGLSLVRALGNEGVMRDIIGYAIANRIYLSSSRASLCAAIPLDSFPHWFGGAKHPYVPDLLLLEARLHDGRFVIDATIVECKVGQRSPTHVEEAVTQAAAGVEHLGNLFLPNSVLDKASEFDRRYWWAQLHRALVMRNVRTISPGEEDTVDQALEGLAEGAYDIRWRAIAATFWTDDGNDTPCLRHARAVGPLPGATSDPVSVDHAAIGQRTTLAALKGEAPDLREQVRPASAAHIGAAMNTENTPMARATAPAATVEVDDYAAPEDEETALVTPTPVPAGSSSDAQRGRTSQPDTKVPPASQRVPALHASGVPDRILLGSEVTTHGGNGTSVYWEYNHPDLPNRHLLVFGGSGAGKTYAIQALLLEMARVGQPSLVIDYTDGFLPRQLEPELREMAPLESFVLATGRKLPLDPFRPQNDEIEDVGLIREKPFDVAKRVASIFTAVYSSLGEQQRATLVDKIEQGITAGGLTLEVLYEQLRNEGEDLLANKLMPLARTAPFTSVAEEAWPALFERSDGRLNILQLARIPNEVQRLIIEFTLWDLWDYLRRTGHKNRPRPVVLDEVQNIDHRSGSPLEKYLREGRKFGASMILATQTMSNFRAEERDRLFQAAHMLFFAPAPTELRSFASILKDREPGSSIEDWSRRLSALKKGECLSTGFEQRPDGSLRSQIRRVAIAPLAVRSGHTP